MQLNDLYLYQKLKEKGYNQSYENTSIEDIRDWLLVNFGCRINVKRVEYTWYYYVFNSNVRKYSAQGIGSPYFNSKYKCWIAAIYYILRFCDLRFRNV